MKKILALLFMLFAATAYAIPPMPSGTPPVGTITGLFTGEGDYLKSDGTKGTPNGSGDVVGPAASTQYKIPLWGAADKTLVDGVAVGTEGMLLRSAGSGANPAWSAYTLALPGAVGAVPLLKDIEIYGRQKIKSTIHLYGITHTMVRPILMHLHISLFNHIMIFVLPI